ncbi:MAG: hypothetical protein Q9160_006151 [Pyrenula sp. 1 TL-2023]
MLLSARPPTPPPSRSKKSAAKTRLPSITPEASPSSADTSLNSSSNGTRKRVDFSPWTDEHQSAKLTPSSSTSQPIKPLPPSRDCKSTKSILKHNAISEQPVSTTKVVPDFQYDTKAMLDSILLQLETADRSTTIDAYANLCATLKAYGDKSDTGALRARMGDLLKYIRRDTQSKSRETGASDSLLVTHALKLLVYMIWNNSFTLLLSDEYRIFIVEQALEAIEDPSTPKAVLLHYLHLLATQTFRASIITTSRALRLLDSLQTVTDHVKGNGIVCERLMVYSRLLDQAESVMRSRTGWIEHLLLGMLLPSKDARSKAIALGLKTASILGERSTFCSVFQQVLDRETHEKIKFSSLACRKLRAMVKSNEETAQVPQIWSVVMLLQKGSKLKPEKWAHFKEWLMVIQTCFNCSDSQTRVQANLAWNRLIYVLPPQESTDTSITNMLVKPIISQLERPGNDKSGKGSRVHAMSSFCTLLYYALRPSGTPASYDRFWETFVSKTFNERYLSGFSNADHACRVIMAICWSSKSKIWREKRAIETSVVEPEELPVLDCKWLRSRSKKVMSIFERLFRSASWGPGKPEQAFVGAAWKHYCLAMGDACRKEVKVSPDTLLCMSSFFELLRKIWDDYLETENKPNGTNAETFQSRFYFISKTMVSEIGHIPFNEPLFRTDDSGLLIPCFSSLQQLGQGTISAAEAIVRMICHYPSGSNTSRIDGLFVEDLLEMFPEPRSSYASLFHFYRCCATAVAGGKLGTSSNFVQLWTSSATMMQKTFNTQLLEKSQSNYTILDSQVQDTVVVLSTGLEFGADVMPTWKNLLQKAMDAVEQINGHLSVLKLILDPLSNFLLTTNPSETIFKYINALLEISLATGRWQTLGLIFESNKRSPLRHDKNLAVSFSSLGTLVDRHLMACYRIESLDNINELASTASAVSNLLALAPAFVLQEILTRLTEALSLWLSDPDRIFISTSELGAARSIIAKKLCNSCLDLMRRLCQHGVSAHDLEKLLAAGLESTHQSVINTTISILGQNFGGLSASEYPATLRTALCRLGAAEEVGLSSLDESSPSREARCVEVLDSQEDGLTEKDDEPFEKRPFHLSIHSLTRAKEWKPRIESHPGGRSFSATANIKSTPILRHDDSQIYFTAVESSPFSESDSQALTENQKDVRDRQRKELATTFTDFATASVSNKEMSRSLRRTNSVSKMVVDRITPPINEPSTPTSTGPQPDDIDDMMPSSPTPSSKSQELRLSEMDVPSSPPTGSDAGPSEVFDNSYVGQENLEKRDRASSKHLEHSNTHKVQKSLPDPAMDRGPSESSLLETSHLLEDDVRLLDEVPETMSNPDPASAREALPCTGPDTGNNQDVASSGAVNMIQATDAAPGEGLNAAECVDEYPLTGKASIHLNYAPSPLQDQDVEAVVAAESDGIEEPSLPSDEADFLSASQLENELNSSAEQEPLQSSLEDLRQALSPVRTSGQISLSQNSPASQTPQSQRPASGAKATQRGSSGLIDRHESSPQPNMNSEIFDCIMVDTTGSQAHSDPRPSSAAMKLHPRSNKGSPRGRKRKILENKLKDGIEVQISPRKKAKATHSSYEHVAVHGCGENSKTADVANEESQGIECVEKDQESNQHDKKSDILSTLAPTLTYRNSHQGVVGLGDRVEEEVIRDEPSSQPYARDLTNSMTTEDLVLNDLQGVLSSLRSGRVSMEGLRNIEDALFQIRVEAQNLVEKGYTADSPDKRRK